MTEPEIDPDLLLAVIESDPETSALLTWAEYAWRRRREGTLTFPVTTVDELEPLFAAAREDGVSNSDITRYRSYIPPGLFPVPTFEDFLRRLRAVIDLAHRVDGDDGRKWPSQV